MTRSFAEILGPDVASKLAQPIEQARGLPSAAYTSQEFYDLEQERLFPRTWMGVAYADDIPEPGDAMPITVLGLPLILVRDKKNNIRAYHNVCRHRATIVLQKPEKGLKNLQCPYHAWTWDLEGNLIATPYFDGTPNSENFSVDKEKNGLVPVRCDEWHRIVFINLEGNAEPLHDYLKPAIELYDHLDIDALRPAFRIDWEYESNWKMVNENWEVYHHIWVHHGIFDKMSDEVELETGEPYTLMVAEGNVLSLRPSPKRPPRNLYGSELPEIPLKEGATKGRAAGIVALLPNTTVSLGMNRSAPVIYTPLSPSRTRAVQSFYFVGDAATDDKLAEAREKAINLSLGTTREWNDKGGIRSQDQNCFVLQQAARYSPVADIVQFSPTWEQNVHYFQNWVAEQLA